MDHVWGRKYNVGDDNWANENELGVKLMTRRRKVLRQSQAVIKYGGFVRQRIKIRHLFLDASNVGAEQLVVCEATATKKKVYF